MKLTFELTSGYFEYAYAMLLLQPELWLCKKIYKVQNKTRINAAYDNVKYFFSCRKIFFLFKVSRMDMCASGVVAHIVVCAGASSLPSSLLSPAQEKSGVPGTRGSTFYWCR